MAYGYYYDFAPYVPVAERRRRAARKLAQLRKKGHDPKPVEIDGRAIAQGRRAWLYFRYENGHLASG